MTMLSPAEIPTGSFPRQRLVLQPKLSAFRVRLASKTGLSTRIVPELGRLCLKWKIQLEENTTSHAPEHIRCRCRKSAIHKIGRLRTANLTLRIRQGLPTIRPQSANATALSRNYSPYRPLPPGNLTAAMFVTPTADKKEGSEADLPRLTVKDRTCRGGFLIDPPGRSQRDACSRRCCASRSHCAIFSSFTA
jgi:hypothetical protein